MKKVHLLCFAAAFGFVVIGAVFRDWLHVLDIVFILLGVALFLLTFWRLCIGRAQRCPNCNAVIHSGHIRTIAGQENGMIPCETCGSLVCVNHSNRR